MKNIPEKIKLFLLAIPLIIGCSEGEDITTDIEFEALLASCGNNNSNSFLFYKVSADQSEFLSFGFESTTFNINSFSEEEITIALNDQNNRFTYRKLSESINPEDYFCNIIPPAENNIDLELQSSNGAGVFSYQLIEETDQAITFDRTLVMTNTTLNGNGISLRNEVIVLGSERITQAK